jgi:flagella basal body P-ring formation protein FlgA
MAGRGSLVYRTEFMVLTAGGKALEDGAMGSIIRVLNSQSKIVVEARVDGGNILSVTNTTFLVMN